MHLKMSSAKWRPFCLSLNCLQNVGHFVQVMYSWFSLQRQHRFTVSITQRTVLRRHYDLSIFKSLRWHHNGGDGVSNHQPHDCLQNRVFRRRSKATSKLCVTGLCVGNSPGTGEFPTQKASNMENVSIWWHHHGNQQVENMGYIGWKEMLFPSYTFWAQYLAISVVMLMI